MNDSQPKIRHALLAGGGTGGHLFPAYAVGDELERRGWLVSFTGRAAGLEADWAVKRSKRYFPIAARAVVGRGPLAKLGAVGTFMSSSLQARGLVIREEVQVVLGTGGYVSVPAVLGARLAGRPTMVFEPNAKPGRANVWLSRLATEAAVAFEAAAKSLRCPTTVTGIPVRREFFELPRLPSLAGGPRLLVLGGSQGARQINQLVPLAVARLIDTLPELRVVHQTGAAHLDETERLYREQGVAANHAEVVAFIDDMPGAMARCHLVISRAGAITLAEISAAARTALLIPLAIAGGHQIDNARVMAATGGAEALIGDQASVERLGELLLRLLTDEAELGARGERLHDLAHPQATTALADRVEALEEAA